MSKPTPSGVLMTVRIPADLDSDVRQLAAARRISVGKALAACCEAGARIYANYGPVGLRELTRPRGNG